MTLAPGELAPAFELPATDGSTASLETLRDGAAALAVAFWCNHCPYVQAWEDRLDDVARDYADRGVRVVAINANDVRKYPADSFENMAARAAEKSYAFAYAFDETQEVPRAYGATRTPEIFLLDGEGRVAYHGAIDDSHDPSTAQATYLRDAIDAVLGGRAPNPVRTPPVGCTIKWRS